MTAASVQELRVLPLVSANLCFAIDGIVGEIGANAQRGKQVAAFDFSGFYNGLGATTVNPAADPSTLIYNSEEIHDTVAPNMLMALRAEDRKAALDKAIGGRFNIYWQKYSNIAQTANQVAQNNQAKLNFLGALTQTAQNKFNALFGALRDPAGSMGGVVKATTSSVAANVVPTLGGDPAKNPVVTQVTNTGYTYHLPSADVDSQYRRAMISLQDQTFAATQTGQMVPQLAAIWRNQLAGVDLDVKRLQTAYLDTILLSPIAGVITGVRKGLGDCVRAGEPVIKVEDYTNVLIVGTVIYPGVPWIGSNVKVTTTLPGANASVTINGAVVSVSGGKATINSGI